VLTSFSRLSLAFRPGITGFAARLISVWICVFLLLRDANQAKAPKIAGLTKLSKNPRSAHASFLKFVECGTQARKGFLAVCDADSGGPNAAKAVAAWRGTAPTPCATLYGPQIVRGICGPPPLFGKCL